MDMRHDLRSAGPVVLHDVPVLNVQGLGQRARDQRHPEAKGLGRRLQGHVAEFLVVMPCCDEEMAGAHGQDVEEGEDVWRGED